MWGDDLQPAPRRLTAGPGCKIIASGRHWLYEILERSVKSEDITLANPSKTRIIAEAQVKTDKVDAFILAQLLRADFIPAVHIPAKETRQRKEVLRQRCFFVRQRTMLRNCIHRLLDGQHDLKLPVVSDLFGRKGMSFLEKLELPAPAGLLLKQQLETVQTRIKEGTWRRSRSVFQAAPAEVSAADIMCIRRSVPSVTAQAANSRRKGSVCIFSFVTTVKFLIRSVV